MSEKRFLIQFGLYVNKCQHGLKLYSFIHSFIHSFILPFIHSFIHSFIHWAYSHNVLVCFSNSRNLSPVPEGQFHPIRLIFNRRLSWPSLVCMYTNSKVVSSPIHYFLLLFLLIHSFFCHSSIHSYLFFIIHLFCVIYYLMNYLISFIYSFIHLIIRLLIHSPFHFHLFMHSLCVIHSFADSFIHFQIMKMRVPCLEGSFI